MKISVPALTLPLAMMSLSLLPGGCSSKSQGVGLRNCYDTGSNVVCVQSSALSTASTDVNGDGKPDVFVCADDDADNHDRKRDEDQSGRTGATGAADEDGDGVADDLDCGHRAECGALTNATEEGGDGEKTSGSLTSSDGAGGSGPSGGDGKQGTGGSGGTGASNSGDNHGGQAGSDGNSGDNHGGQAGSDGSGGDNHGGQAGSDGSGGDNHGGQAGSDGSSGDNHGGQAGSDGSSGDNHGGQAGSSGDNGGKDEHPQTGCQPPPLTPPAGM